MEGLRGVHPTIEEIQQNPYGVLTRAIIGESVSLLLLLLIILLLLLKLLLLILLLLL